MEFNHINYVGTTPKPCATKGALVPPRISTEAHLGETVFHYNHEREKPPQYLETEEFSQKASGFFGAPV